MPKLESNRWGHDSEFLAAASEPLRWRWPAAFRRVRSWLAVATVSAILLACQAVDDPRALSDLTMTPVPTVATAAPSQWQPTPAPDSAEVGKWYPFVTGHCGVYSPIGFDGSFWIPVAIAQPASDTGYHAGNSAAGEIALADDNTAYFRTSDGFVARLIRSEAPGAWPCM